ncbi:DsrE family protein [Rhodovulum euryhalinum]|uniref:DsrE/DsrF/DsrH-like protein n=1 Tax=Rhodovulum euryhalinum TaxID=35805 RepID=A0A4V2SAT8_9RHOB|nr:DsrE family protein [Rhodovulum euryhalinum]TCO72880.1 DsrE/DsrF/DsrH-like protein [Rhodovulum euryhalinum]
MIRTFKATALVLALTATAAAADDVSRLVAVVTDANPQTQLMSMVLTNQAIDRGVPTRILLCGPAADIALKDAPETATAPQPPRGASPQALLQAAMKKGARAEVCAIYLPGKGLAADALIEGVGVAEPPAMAKAMADRRARIWSF